MVKKYLFLVLLAGICPLFGADTLFHEDFSAGTTDSLTILSGSWLVQGGTDKYLIQTDLSYSGYHTVLFGPDTLRDFVLTARFRAQSGGGVAFHIGCADSSTDSTRTVLFDCMGSVLSLLSPDGTTAAALPYAMVYNRWYAVRIARAGAVLEVAVDDTVRLVRTAPAGPVGRVGISGVEDARFLADDLVITGPVTLPYHAPVFITTAADLPGQGYVDVPYTATLQATDADTGDSVRYGALTPLPAGTLAVDPLTGAVRWVPAMSDTGSMVLRLTAFDGMGLADTLSVLVTVARINHAPSFISLPSDITDSAFVSAMYRDTLQAADPDSDDLTYTRLAGPSGMFIDPGTGTMAWIPVMADTGIHTVSVSVADPGGLADTITFTVSVTVSPSINVAPVFVSTASSMQGEAVEGLTYRDTLSAMDANPGDVLTYYLGTSYPDSMTLNGSSGALRWTPTQADTGLHTVQVGVRDAAGEVDTFSFVITVRPGRPSWCECSEYAPVLEWYRIYDDSTEREAEGLVQGDGGSYIMVGSDGTSDDRLLVLGADARGESLWADEFPVDAFGAGADVVRAADSGYAVAGTGGDDFFLVKYAPDGAVMWNRRYALDGDDRCHGMARAADGGFLLAGEVKSPVNGDWDARLIRTDAAGDTLWTRRFGGLNNDNARAAAATYDNGFVITGATRSYAQEGFDLWLIRLDSTGQTLWTRTFDGPELSSFEYGYDIRQTTDLGYIVAGRTSSLGGAQAYGWLVKTDRQGDTLWTRVLSAGAGGELRAVRQTADEGYVVTGYTGTDARMALFDKNGDPVWDCAMGGGLEDRGLDVIQAADGGMVMTGYTMSFGGADRDRWLLKFAAQNEPVFSSTVDLVVDSVAGAAGLLTGLVDVHYTFNDTAGRAYRVGEMFYSAGDSLHWNRAGLNAVLNNPYRTAGSYAVRFNTAVYLDSLYTDPLYLRFCVADTGGTGGWDEIDTIPEARTQFAAAVIGTRIYTVGGFIPGTGYTGRCALYDAVRGRWSEKASMTTARKQLGAAVVDGMVYALGGWTGSVPTGAVEVYDPATNTWEQRSPMPTPRYAFGTAVVGGKIYTVGGFNMANAYVDKVEIYDPGTDTWATGMSLPEARYAPAVGVAQDRIYVFGGYNTFTGGFFSEVLEYDPVTDSWAVRAVIPSGRHSLQAVTVNGRLLLAGGWDKTSGELDVVEEFDPENYTWRTRPSLTRARTQPALAAVAGRVFAFSGLSGGVTVNSIEKYTASVYSNYAVTGPLRVDNNLLPVIFTTHPDSVSDTAYEDLAYADTLAAYTPIGDSVFFFSFLHAPDSARIDSASGIITWLPVAADTGLHVFRARVTDRRRLVADTLNFTVEVISVNDPPLAGSLAVPSDTVTEGDTVLLHVTAADEENDSIMYQWLRGDTVLGTGPDLVYGVPYDAAPLDTLILMLYDDRGAAGYDTIVLAVRNRGLAPRLLVEDGDTLYPDSLARWGWPGGLPDPELDTLSTLFSITVYRDSACTETVLALDSVAADTGRLAALLDPAVVGPGLLWWVTGAYDTLGYATGRGRAVRMFYYNLRFMDMYFPDGFTLSAVRPNPFGTRVRFEVTIPPDRTATFGNWPQLEGQTRQVNISVYNAYGMRVKHILTGKQIIGRYVLEWDGRDDRNKGTPGGIYFITAEGCGTVLTRRVIKSQNSPY